MAFVQDVDGQLPAAERGQQFLGDDRGDLAGGDGLGQGDGQGDRPVQGAGPVGGRGEGADARTRVADGTRGVVGAFGGDDRAGHALVAGEEGEREPVVLAPAGLELDGGVGEQRRPVVVRVGGRVEPGHGFPQHPADEIVAVGADQLLGDAIDIGDAAGPVEGEEAVGKTVPGLSSDHSGAEVDE